MCTLVILRRPDHRWPVLIGANRDEMIERPWQPPGAPLARSAGGDCRARCSRRRFVARHQRLGGRCRGIEPNRLTRPGAGSCARAANWCWRRSIMPMRSMPPRPCRISNPTAYRTFNLIVADERDGFWLRHAGGRRVEIHPIKDGLSLIAAGESTISARRRLQLAIAGVSRLAGARTRSRGVDGVAAIARQSPGAAGRAGDRGDAFSHRRLRHGVERADRIASARGAGSAAGVPLCLVAAGTNPVAGDQPRLTG